LISSDIKIFQEQKNHQTAGNPPHKNKLKKNKHNHPYINSIFDDKKLANQRSSYLILKRKNTNENLHKQGQEK
jgi:hypothetical protein